MIRAILTGRQPVKRKVKKLARYYSLKRASTKVWKKKHTDLYSKFPDYNCSLDASLRRTHRRTWEVFNRNFNDATLKVCRGISGISDPMIVPEEIFRTDIEPTLNCHPEAHFQANKSFYNQWFGKGIFPDDLMHNVNGELLDQNLLSITLKQAESLCRTFQYPVVVKPNRGSYGGKDVRFINDAFTLKKLIRQKKDIVIQKKVPQHPSMARYYGNSINTVRVYTYKSVTDNQIHILGMMPRMGNGGTLDNVSSGGMASYINKKGHLPGYALGCSLQKFSEHPQTGVAFTGPIPKLEKLKELSLKIAQQLYLLRIIGLDLCYDESGCWRVIEINTQGHTIRSLQYHGIPFFGQFTEEVIEYCKLNHWAKK